MNNSNLIIREVIPNSKIIGRTFRFPLDSGKDFDYRARISIDCFFYKRNKKKDGTIYVCAREFDFNISEQVTKNSFLKNNITYTAPIFIELKSIWELYTTIGYDYKKKKWLN